MSAPISESGEVAVTLLDQEGAQKVELELTDKAGNVKVIQDDIYFTRYTTPEIATSELTRYTNKSNVAWSEVLDLEAAGGSGNYAVDVQVSYTAKGQYYPYSLYGTSSSFRVNYPLSGDTVNPGYFSYSSDISVTYRLVDTVTNKMSDWSTSQPLSLDTSVPSGTVSINGGNTYADSRTVNLNYYAYDSKSGIQSMYYKVNDGEWIELSIDGINEIKPAYGYAKITLTYYFKAVYSS